MTDDETESGARDWLEAELADTLDEDYELELSEPALSLEIRKIYKRAHPPSIDRIAYFRALLRLQSELIKLQSWVAYHKQKVVVIFEGRDSAGRATTRAMRGFSRWVMRLIAPPLPALSRPSKITTTFCL